MVDNDTSIEVFSTEDIIEIEFPNETIIETKETTDIVVEVFTGKPGAQNLFTGTTAPSNPQEGWVWIDTT